MCNFEILCRIQRSLQYAILQQKENPYAVFSKNKINHLLRELLTAHHTLHQKVCYRTT